MRSGQPFSTLILLAALCVASGARAQEELEIPGAPRDGETFTVITENDLFGGTDRNYTNGLFMSRLSAADDVPDWYAAFARQVGFADTDDRLRLGIGFGHSIFTPQNTAATNPPLDERPYAGWLYASALLVAETTSSIRSLQINLGVVGPSAQGEFVQDNWHRLLDEDRPRGWDYQLADEPGLLVIFEQRGRRVSPPDHFMGLQYEIQAGVTAAAGNVATYGGANAMIRFGPHIGDDYGPPRIRPSLAGAAYFDPPPGFNWHIFAGGELRAVAHNIFLDGNSWVDSRSVESLPLTGDLQFGVTLQYKTYQLAFSGVHRFEEYEGQDGADRFGAVIFSKQF